MALTTEKRIALVGVGIASAVVIGGIIYYFFINPPSECTKDSDCISPARCYEGRCVTDIVEDSVEQCPPESPKWVESLQRCMYGYCTTCGLWFETKGEYDYHNLVYHPKPMTKTVEWAGSATTVVIDANELGENAPTYVSMLYLEVRFDALPDSKPWWCHALPGSAPSLATVRVFIDGKESYNGCMLEWTTNPIAITVGDVINDKIEIYGPEVVCPNECPGTWAEFKDIKVTVMRGVI